MAKGERFDWLIGKCTELGVNRICPIVFERTVKLAKNPKALQRWQRLTIAAAKQCRRLLLPRIDKPLTLPKALEWLKKDYIHAQILFGCLDKNSPALINFSFGDSDVIAFISPEGGMTENEQLLLNKEGAESVRLTETILRVETATLAFASILTAQRDARCSILNLRASSLHLSDNFAGL